MVARRVENVELVEIKNCFYRSISGMDFPELLFHLTGDAALAAAVRLVSPDDVRIWQHAFSYLGVHILVPGRRRAVYVFADNGSTTLEAVLARAATRWGCVSREVWCVWNLYPRCSSSPEHIKFFSEQFARVRW